MHKFCQAFLAGDTEEIAKQLTMILGKMISIPDTKARDDQKENFYHGLLLGLLRSEPSWLILSNAESDERLRNDGRKNIIGYGIAFFRKRCKVECVRL